MVSHASPVDIIPRHPVVLWLVVGLLVMDDPKRAKIEVLTSLVWSECKNLPNGVWDSQTVTLEEKVFVGGGKTSRTDTNLGAELHIYLPKTNLWRGMHTPVYYFALTTYRSQLALIGGYEFVDEGNDILTNKLWTLYKYTQWQETLPPMQSKRYGASAVSHGDHLIVAGGGNNYETLDIVEVYDGQHWSYVQPLPNQCGDMKSVVFDGHWYLMGGYEQDEEVYYAALDLLITSNEMSQPSIWKELPNVPFWYSSPAVLGKRLVSIGGGHLSLYSNVIHAYSQSIKSWVHVGEMPIGIANTSSTVLPTGELMIIGGLPESASNSVFKAALEGSTELENQLHLIAETIHALKQEVTQLEEECGSLMVENEHLKSQVSTIKHVIDRQTETDASTIVLKSGMQAKVNESINVVEEKSATIALEERIKELQSNVEDLASQIEMYINQTAMKSSEGKVVNGSDSIYDLKQNLLSLKKEKYSTMLTVKNKIKELKFERKQLESQLTVSPMEKQEAELKEEAVTTNKAEATFDQPTTATWNLRGVEVCGEMTVVVYSSHDQQITWPGYGLRLHIPKGCLPADMEQCTINIKASLAGQYEFPENSHLISAVFWLCCENVHKFVKQITVEIQHCAKLENVTDLNLSFVRAVCSQKQLPYTFKQLPGGNFTSHSSYGVIELNSFSGVGIVQTGSDKRQYCSKIFFLNNYFGGHRIDLIITWDTEAHLNVVKRYYKEEKALPGPDQLVDFEGEEIRIDLPMEGTKINDKWTIVPLIDPVVTKDEVDSYLPGKRIPHCELVAHPLGEPIIRLVHRVILLGAKPPRNMFNLTYMPPTASTIGSPHDQVSEPAKPKLKDLQRELYSKVANEWEDIGIQLDIEEGQLKQIKSDHTGDSKACLREMLRVWLSYVAPPPSWSAIADALKTLGHQDIASHLRIKYQYRC